MRRCAFLTTRLMKIERAQQAPENGVRFPFRVDDLIELLKKRRKETGAARAKSPVHTLLNVFHSTTIQDFFRQGC